MTSRSYETFDRPINGVSDGLTGANALDVARIGMDQALLTRNATLLRNAYQRFQSELVIKNKVEADGIRADGSFGRPPLIALCAFVILSETCSQGNMRACFTTGIMVNSILRS